MATTGWKIVAEPQGDNASKVDQAVGAVKDALGRDTLQGKNTGGMVIYVTDAAGGNKQEVSRVGFVRRNTKNPKVSFDKQLQAELAKAEKTIEALNRLAGDGELQ